MQKRPLTKFNSPSCYGIFGINEPIIFGLPIVLNPVMLIPFILTPVVNIIIAYFIMDLGLVPLCNGAIFEELKKDAPKREFTVGIVDDVTTILSPQPPK